MATITGDAQTLQSHLKDVAHAGKDVFDLLTLKRFDVSKIATVMFTTEETTTWRALEDMENFEPLTEHQVPNYANLKEGRQISCTPGRHGRQIGYSEKQLMDMEDKTINMKEFAKKQHDMLIEKGQYALQELVVSAYENAFTSFLAPDGNPMIGNHVDVDNNNWFNNRLTGNPKLTKASIKQLDKLGSSIKTPNGKQAPIKYDTIIVREFSDNHDNAEALFNSVTTPTTIGEVNIYRGKKTVITHPLIPENSWFAFNSKLGNPLSLLVRKKVFINPKNIRPTDALGLVMPATFFAATVCKDMPFMIAGSDGSESN